MTVQFSVAVRNARADAKETQIGTAAKIRIYSGSIPANCAASITGTLLVEYTLASDWSAAASSGAKSLSSTPISGTAVAAGTASHYRIWDSAGTTCGEQGTVTATGGGGDVTIDNVVIANAQSVNITSWSWTEAGA